MIIKRYCLHWVGSIVVSDSEWVNSGCDWISWQIWRVMYLSRVVIVCGTWQKHPASPRDTAASRDFQIKAAPHDGSFRKWTQPCITAGPVPWVCRCVRGIPTIIKPFFGYLVSVCGRVEDLARGFPWKAQRVQIFQGPSRQYVWKVWWHVQQTLASVPNENGVETAIDCIYREYELCQSLNQA